MIRNESRPSVPSKSDNVRRAHGTIGKKTSMRILSAVIAVAVLGIATAAVMADSDNSDAAGATVTTFAELNAALVNITVTEITVNGDIDVTGNIFVAKNLTINSGKTLTVKSSVSATISVAGVKLTNNGTLINEGTLTINSSAEATNSGTMINRGTVLMLNGTLTNNGTATNSGSIESTGGTISGTGTVTITGTGKVKATFAGTAPNFDGKFTFQHGSEFILNSLLKMVGPDMFSSLKTESGATVEITAKQGTGMSYKVSGGTVAINRQISTEADTFGFRAGESMTIDSGATVVINSNMKVQLQGAAGGMAAAAFTNNGTVTNNGEIQNAGVLISNGNVVNNRLVNNIGKMTLNGTMTNNYQVNSVAGSIDGTGTITTNGNTDAHLNTTMVGSVPQLPNKCVFKAGARLMIDSGNRMIIGIASVDVCPQMLIGTGSQITFERNAKGCTYEYEGTINLNPTPKGDYIFKLEKDDVLVVKAGSTAIIGSGCTLTNNGTITVNGTLTNNGTIENFGVINGTVGGGTVNNGIRVNDGTPSVTKISTGPLSSDLTVNFSRTGYKLTSATVKMNGVALESSKFTVGTAGVVLKSGLNVTGAIDILANWTSLTPGSDPTPEPTPSGGTDNTMLYVGAAAAVIGIIAVAGYMFTRRGKV